jgi:hypothetical protein
MVGGAESENSEPPLIECDLPLGEPGLVVNNRLLLSGWAASPRGVTGVIVNVDERAWTAAFGLDAASPGSAAHIEGAEHGGYRLEIDTSGWTPGPRYVAVAAYDADGRRSTVEGAIDVRPFLSGASKVAGEVGGLEGRDPTLSLESPHVDGGAAEGDTPLEVRGWAHAKDGIEAVLVTLDGVAQYEALRPISRPDLIGDIGRDAAGEAGFCLVLDPVDCPPGRHDLTVTVLGRDGELAGVECDLLSRPAPDRSPVHVLPNDRHAGNGSGAPDDEPAWQERALLAEADAARSRAEARLAIAGQKRARRELRRAVDEPAGRLASVGRELTGARADLVAARREIEEGAARQAAATEEVRTLREGIEAAQAELQAERAELSAARNALAQRTAALEGVFSRQPA